MALRAPLKMLLVCCVLSPLAACTTVVAATPASPRPDAATRDYALRPGGQVTLADHSLLRYVGVPNDSRCAPTVQCIWAGDAQVAFTWAPADGPKQTFILHTGKEPRQHAIDARRVTLVSLARGPAPEATVRVDPAAP